MTRRAIAPRRLHPPSDETAAKFIADAMLRSLSRKMRILGFDVKYFRDGPDAELERIAGAEGRVIITGDRGLFAHATRHGTQALLITGMSDAERLSGLVSSAEQLSIPLHHGQSRCALCNTPLDMLARKEVLPDVPPSVARRHRVYYRCPDCRKVYWKGGHWIRLRKVAALVPRQ
jgi:uncharacterized protein with PIN domain